MIPEQRSTTVEPSPELPEVAFPVDWGHPCRFVWRAPVPMRAAFWLLDRDGAPWRWW